MSFVNINGALVLDGNLTCNGDITVTPIGLVVPVPDEDSKKSFYSHERDFKFSNGFGRRMTSTTGSIYHQGLIDGRRQGFDYHQGPGANSLLTDSSGNRFEGYGATHAGLGAINSIGNTPPPEEAYGFRESPVSLGSGGGYFKFPDTTDNIHYYFVQAETATGGGAIKLEAPSGIVQVGGTITMDGEDGTHAGGAAGGSIWLTGWGLDGTGILSVQGGVTHVSVNAGGGGGGYISLWYERTNTFSGNIAVNGNSGGGDGKTFVKQIEPFLEDPFSGTILNTKWWDSTGSAISNGIQLTSLQDNYSFPSVTSIFGVSGKNIVADMEFFTVGSESYQYQAEFVLWADSNNWIGLARRQLGLYGISSSEGLMSVSGIPFDYTNVTFRILKNDSTFHFQYYDATSTPQTIYSDVRPGLANKYFKIKTELDKLNPVPAIIDQLRLTPLDIANSFVQIDQTPANPLVALNVITGTAQQYGYDFFVSGNQVHWDTTTASNFKNLIAMGDVVRVVFGWNPPVSNAMQAGFRNLKIYQGVPNKHTTEQSALYVDPDFGSDMSSGQQLSPLKNLFVATAWSRPGGTVVLYDGTYNPTRVKMKNVTIRGAEGASPYITSSGVQDTTGSGWENTALHFYKSEGLVYNVQVGDSTYGIFVENSPDFEIARCSVFNTEKSVVFSNSDPTVRRSLLHNNNVCIDATACSNLIVNSNVIYDSLVGVSVEQSLDATITGNTIDNFNQPNAFAMVFNNHASGVVSSNCVTYGNTGLVMSLDSSVGSFNNNYVFLANNYSRAPDSSANDISSDPIYVDSLNHNYHIAMGSPNIDHGVGTYDNYFTDFDGASRIDNT
jgi:hypothetical protein